MRVAAGPAIARKIPGQGADYPLAVKANQPTVRAEVEACFADAPEEVAGTFIGMGNGHGRIEERALICRCRRQLASG